MVCLETITLEPTNSFAISLINLGSANNVNEKLVTAANEIINENDINEEHELYLFIADSFLSWELVKVHLNNYAKAVGFSLRRKRVTTNNEGEIT